LIAASAQGFAEQVANLLIDQELRGRLARQGREHVVRNYTWEKSRSGFCSIVENAGMQQSGARKMTGDPAAQGIS
jgi:glycosyltransferase involved in cell wall biosynthesis